MSELGRHMWKQGRYVLLSLTVLLQPTVVNAEALKAERFSNFTLQIDNDLLYGTDREYTGGFKFKWAQEQCSMHDYLSKPFQSWVKHLQLKAVADQTEVGIEAFTLMRQDEDDRLQNLYNEAWSHIDLRRFYEGRELDVAWTVTAGWLGPDSPGKGLQNDLHSLIGNDPADDALYELPNQPTLQLGVDIKSDWFQWQDWSLYKSFWLKAGSPWTHAYAGVGLMRTFGQVGPRLLYNQVNSMPLKAKASGGFYFGSVGASYLFYSALADGRIFSDDPNKLERYRWVPMLQYGAGYQFETFSVSLSGNAIGQVYKDQPENFFRFASLTFTWAI